MACWLSRNWWIFIQTVQHQLRQKYFFREFKRQQQQSTNFFPQESLVLVYHIQRGRIFSCLFVWLFVFALCIFVCASLSLVVLCVIGCHTLSRGLPNVRLFPLIRTNPILSYRNDYGQPEKFLCTWIQDGRQYVAANH